MMMLIFNKGRLTLSKIDEPKLGAIYVNFISGTLAYRRRFVSKQNEAIARAVGFKYGQLIDVVDATAGLGRDAFILATLGCRVRMLERHPIVIALLNDGLKRGYQDVNIGHWLSKNLTLVHAMNLMSILECTPRPQVVYLDPMYPNRKKSALVKKEMRILQLLVGSDDDADELLSPARQLATQRVVVKRPNYAPPLGEVAPHSSVLTKNHRFDIYMPK